MKQIVVGLKTTDCLRGLWCELNDHDTCEAVAIRYDVYDAIKALRRASTVDETRVAEDNGGHLVSQLCDSLEFYGRLTFTDEGVFFTKSQLP